MSKKSAKITRLVPRNGAKKDLPPVKADSFLNDVLMRLKLPLEPKSISYKIKKTFAHLKPEIREAKFEQFAAADFNSQNNNIEQMLTDKLPEIEQQYELALQHFKQLKKQAEAVKTIDVTPAKKK